MSVWLFPDGVEYFAILVNEKQPRSLGASWGKAVLEEYEGLSSPGKEAAHSQTTLIKDKLFPSSNVIQCQFFICNIWIMDSQAKILLRSCIVANI